MDYKTDTKVQYTNTTEYRICLRELFSMKKENIDKTLQEYNTVDIDEESLDELAYDQESSDKVLTNIFESTKDNAIFQDLYSRAAALMISEDMNIGLAILFSYDYLHLFHRCLIAYFSDNSFSETNPHVVALAKKLS